MPESGGERRAAVAGLVSLGHLDLWYQWPVASGESGELELGVGGVRSVERTAHVGAKNKKWQLAKGDINDAQHTRTAMP